MPGLAARRPRRAVRAERYHDVLGAEASQCPRDADRLGGGGGGGHAERQACLCLVDDENVDARHESGVGGACGGQVEQDARAKRVRPREGFGVGLGGDLRLEDDDVGGGGEQRGLGGLDGHGRVRPGVEDDRVLTRGGDSDERGPGGSVDLAQVGDVHAVRRQLRAQALTRGIRTDRTHEEDGDPRMCGGGRLVRALTAEAVGERGARERFAGLRETVDGDRDVLVDGTDNDDTRHGAPLRGMIHCATSGVGQWRL